MAVSNRMSTARVGALLDVSRNHGNWAALYATRSCIWQQCANGSICPLQIFEKGADETMGNQIPLSSFTRCSSNRPDPRFPIPWRRRPFHCSTNWCIPLPFPLRFPDRYPRTSDAKTRPGPGPRLSRFSGRKVTAPCLCSRPQGYRKLGAAVVP